MYTTTLRAGWGDMDFNGHMRNTAYLDKAGDTRMLFFQSRGYPLSEFSQLRFGPVVLKDEVEYFREVGMLEEITVNILIAGLSADCSNFLLRNEFHRHDGRLAARVTSACGWLDLATRKLIAPPEGLCEALRALPRTEDFRECASRIKGQ